MANRRAKIINSGYHNTYRKKPSKGIGVYALQPKGAGPNGVHDSARAATCLCGGCSAKAAS